MSIINRIRLYFDGHRRVKGGATTGRIYTKKGNDKVPGQYQAKAEPKASLEMKIIRANGDVEYATAPVTVERV